MNLRSYIIALAAAIAPAALADGFIGAGGSTATADFQLEPVVSGFTATDDAVLSHGFTPARSNYNSGIEGIAINVARECRAIVEGSRLTVEGAPENAPYVIYSIDGRWADAGMLCGAAADIDVLASGHYLISLPSCGTTLRFFKR